MTRDDTSLLVVTSGIASKFENLGTKVLENSSEVDGSSSTHTLAVLSLTEVTSDTTNGELKTSFGRSGGGLLLSTAALSFSCVVENGESEVISLTLSVTTVTHKPNRHTVQTNLPFPDMMRLFVVVAMNEVLSMLL
jgi:hypothetical protein